MSVLKMKYKLLICDVLTFKLSVCKLKRVMKTVELLDAVVHLKPIKFRHLSLLKWDNLKDCIGVFNKYTNGEQIILSAVQQVLQNMGTAITNFYASPGGQNLIGILLHSNSSELSTVQKILGSLIGAGRK